VVGRVSALTALDSGRVMVGSIAVREVLKGALDAGEEGRVRVVEMRDPPSAPAILREGDEVVAFLRPAERGSYLRKLLPPGRHHAPAGGRYGVVAARETSGADEIRDVVAQIAAASRAPDPDPAKQQAARRSLVFAEVGASHPTLVEDGAAGLAGIDGLASSLTPEERSSLDRALRRTDLPDRVRALLIDAVGEARLEALAPTLGELEGGAEVHAARWRALAALGRPPSSEELVARLASPEGDVRVAAASALLREAPEEGLAPAARLAREDADASVRSRVLEALGKSAGTAAIPTLEEAIAKDTDLGARQAAARALFQVGGREAVAAFGRAAFSAPLEEQRRAVAMIRALGAPDDDPALERIRREHPDPKTREIAEHGLPVHHH
jgi:HEAT repeat protein